jgi:hypothetical protein
LKAVDPEIDVVGGVVEGFDEKWIDEFGRAGGFDFVDAFSVHPYVLQARLGPESSISRLDAMTRVVQRYAGKRRVPMLVTEIGWVDKEGGTGITESLAAHYLMRFMLLARAREEVEGVWWYVLTNRSTDRDKDIANFGLVRHDLTPKEGYYAFQAIGRLFEGLASATETRLPGNIHVVKGRYDSGGCFTAAWLATNDPREQRQVVVRAEGREATFWPRKDGVELKSGDQKVRVGSEPIIWRSCADVLPEIQ